MSSRHFSLPTEITEGKQVAVAGTVSFYPPYGNASILVDEVRPIEEDGAQRLYDIIPVRLWIAIAAVLVLVLGGFLLLT